MPARDDVASSDGDINAGFECGILLGVPLLCLEGEPFLFVHAMP